MKKIIFIILSFCLTISFSACFSLSPQVSRSINSRVKLEEIFVEGKTTIFEVEELLGEATLKEDKNLRIQLSYADGSFFRKNTKKNREFLKPYILDYYLEDETRFQNTFLLLDFYYEKVKDEYILSHMWFSEI